MKKLLLILSLFIVSLTVNSQSYECRDINDKTFDIFITPGHYNFVLDSFIIVTELDTIIQTDKYVKYIPVSNLSDTMTIITSNNSIYFSNENGLNIAHFTIIKQLNDEEFNALMNKRYILLNSN